MRRRKIAVGAVAAALLVAGAAFAYVQTRERDLPGQADTDRTSPSAGSGRVPAFKHVYLIVFENQDFSAVLGSGAAPYLTSLAARYGSATNYDAIRHPSQPNYIALFSGSIRGVTDDKPHDLVGPNLADQLEAKGRTWRVFAENYPGGCFTGATASGGPDGPGTYARKHNPAISFSSISTSPTRCANITDFSHFDPAAADFEMIVPNLCHDMHDCSIGEGDTWLSGFLPRILESGAWKDGGAVFITFDEGSQKETDSQHVSTVVMTPGMKAGTVSATHYTHYSLLRTIQQAWGLGCIDESCEANDMGDLFSGPAPGSSPGSSASVP